jgi:tetraacyldisaccharide 4'-kinase
MDVLSSTWGLLAAPAVVRPLKRPPHTRLVAIGGATLGGSGKTPLAIACAAELAAAGCRVAFVGHAYRASPRRARIVNADDAVAQVGDEALIAARALGSLRVPVVVAPRRAQAVHLASRLAEVLVLDGVAQTEPRASIALLAVDAAEPWGSARLPPKGDLRAPIPALLAACDMIVRLGAELPTAAFSVCHSTPTASARLYSRGAWIGQTLFTWSSFAGIRVGLLSALSRPERIVRALRARGISLETVIRARDHGPFSPRTLASAARARVDLWLATDKCAVHLRAPLPAPVAILDKKVVLSPLLRARLLSTAPRPAP